MNTAVKISEGLLSIRIGKKPVVVLPLAFWQEIENKLENFEMMNSDSFKEKISKARAEKKSYTSSEVKKMLKIY